MVIRTLSHTVYALLATLTTGRSLRLVQRVPNRNGFEVWRQLVAENAPKTAGRRFRSVASRVAAENGDNTAKFEEAWNAWEHQVDVHQKLATSKLDDDVKISVVLREAPTKTPRQLAGELSTVREQQQQVSSNHPSVLDLEPKLDGE